MTEIPKLPTKEQQPTNRYTDLHGVTWTPRTYYDHEHAVARVAVEALRELACEWDYQAEKFIENCKRAGCARCEALAKIEASGWKP